VRAVAVSQSYGPATSGDGDPFAAARGLGADLIRRLMVGAAWTHGAHGVFYNVNFPARAAGDVAGVRATVQGHRPGATFGIMPQTAPNGRKFLWLTHGTGNADTERGSDSRECHDGHVTVTPLTADLTVHALVEPLSRIIA